MRIIFLLIFVTAFFIFLPVIIGGFKGIFFSIDPDTHYIGNAVSWIKANQITYINHPATPSILFYVYSLTPFRFYAKYIQGENFVNWFILHADIVFFYLRSIQLIIFSTALLIFLKAIEDINKSTYSVCFSWLSIFLFSFFPYLGVYIRSETTSFFILSIWFFTLVRYIKNNTYLTTIILTILSAIAVANKLTNIFYFVISIVLAIGIKKISITKRAILLFTNVFLGAGAFFVSTWPIHQQYAHFFSFASNLFTHTDMMGYGKESIFDLQKYTQSFTSSVSGELFAYLFIFLTLIAFIFFEIFKKKNKYQFTHIVLIFFLTIGILAFAKYPWSYYQTSNYLGFVFIGSLLFMHLSKIHRKLICSLLLILVINNFYHYHLTIKKEISYTRNLENYISNHPPKIATIWEWGRAKDFALLWGNSWSGGNYSQELKSQRPDLLFEIDNFKNSFPQQYKAKGIFSVCWDQLYIQKKSIGQFISKENIKYLAFEDIPNSDGMVYISSNHCNHTVQKS